MPPVRVKEFTMERADRRCERKRSNPVRSALSLLITSLMTTQMSFSLKSLDRASITTQQRDMREV